MRRKERERKGCREVWGKRLVTLDLNLPVLSDSGKVEWRSRRGVPAIWHRLVPHSESTQPFFFVLRVDADGRRCMYKGSFTEYFPPLGGTTLVVPGFVYMFKCSKIKEFREHRKRILAMNYQICEEWWWTGKVKRPLLITYLAGHPRTGSTARSKIWWEIINVCKFSERVF